MNYSPAQQSGPHFASPITPPQPPKPPSSTAGKWLIVSGLLFGTVLLALTGTCAYFLVVTPADRVITGPQIPSEYIAQIRALGILDPDERIDFFFSDGWWNIEEGFYYSDTDHLNRYYSDCLRIGDDETTDVFSCYVSE